ncbi:MAG TPA: GyrI-like domain-containing protein [Anaeromyxobacter sp.]
MEPSFPPGAPSRCGGCIEAKARPRTWPYTCGIKETDASLVMVRRAALSPEELESFIRSVEEDLTRAGRARQGPPMVVVSGRADPRPDAPPRVEVAVMLPVAAGTSPPQGFEAKSLPGEPVAYTVHHGRSDALLAAEAVLAAWVKMKSLVLSGEVRRIYLKRGKNPRKDVTEVQIPLSR